MPAWLLARGGNRRWVFVAVRQRPRESNQTVSLAGRSVAAAPLTVALALGVSSCANAQSPNTVPLDAFIVAHQDDWQLFMGDVASKGIRNGNHAVFIYLTAGDENRDSAYWEARERDVQRMERSSGDSKRDCQ